MVCKTCGTQLQNGATFCPNCGLTVHYPQNNGRIRQPVYPQQQNYNQQPAYGRQPNYVQQPAYNYQQPNYGYPPQNQKAIKSTGGISAYVYVFIFIIIGMLTAGVFYVSAFQTRLMEDNYVGTNLLSTIAVLKEVGFSDFSAEIDDDMTMLTVYTMLATSGVTLIFAVISFITLYLKKIPLAVKILGISAIFPAVSYIMLFIEGVHIRSKNSDSEILGDLIRLSPAPVIMALMCIGVAILSFMASKKLK
ncbi:MAG: zinc ribbon domain-containing protein [Ruminococcus sp.]|nr:zinc ribbon domain-containing protein [Ruminococcus sp.]